MIRGFSYPLIEWIIPMLAAFGFIALVSLIADDTKRRMFNAILVAGAGAAYLGGGLGVWEFPFDAVMAVIAYKGLESNRWLGAGWLLHTGWDLVHHMYGNPIMPFYEVSSFGCAVCDPIIAVWLLADAPSVWKRLKVRSGSSSPGTV